MKLQVNDSIVTLPTSCACGGNTAYFLKRANGTKISIGCTCCTAISINIKQQSTHRAYGKILIAGTWHCSPTYKGNVYHCGQMIATWFSTKGQEVDSPWAVYYKPIIGGSYKLLCEQHNGAALLHKHSFEQISSEIQDLLNKLSDLECIKSQCQKLNQHGMAIWATLPKLDPPFQLVRDAATMGLLNVKGGKMFLTETGLAYADTSTEGFNSRKAWHGWTCNKY